MTLNETIRDWVGRNDGQPFVKRDETVREMDDPSVCPNRYDGFRQILQQAESMYSIPSMFSRVEFDPSVPPDEIRMVSTPFSHDSVMARIARGERPLFRNTRRQDMIMYGSGLGEQPTRENVPEYGPEGTAIANAVVGEPNPVLQGADYIEYRGGQPVYMRPRPDHYRVRGGRCACGFQSMFTGEMDRHIQVANTGSYSTEPVSGPTDGGWPGSGRHG